MVAVNASSFPQPAVETDAFAEAMFAQSGVGVARLDAAGRIARCNDAFAGLTGRPAGDLPGTALTDYLHPDDAGDSLSTGRSERRFVRPGGDVVFAAVTVSPLPGEGAGFALVAVDLSEQRKSAEALAEARGRFESALLASEIGTYVWLLDSDRVFGDANFARIFGVVPDPDGGANAWEYTRFVHEDDRTRVNEAVRQTIETGEPYVVEYRVVLGGRTRWVDARGRVERDADGRVTRFLGVVFDTTARKLKDQQARASEQRDDFLNELGELTRDTSDPVEVMSSVTRRVAEQFGSHRCAYADVDPDEEHFVIRGDYAAEGYTSSAGEYLLSGFGKAASTAMRAGRMFVVRDVERELGDDGAGFLSIAIRAIIVCPLIRGGRLVAMMAVHQGHPRDWTETEQGLMAAIVERSWAFVQRARADREREQSEQNFRQLADAMPQIVWAAQPDGTVDYFNRRWHEYTGLPPGILDADAWRTICAPDDLPRVGQAWDHSARTGEPFELEFRLRRASDGAQRWHLGRALPVKDAGGRVLRWYGTNTDIHDQRLAEAAVTETEARFRTMADSAPVLVWIANTEKLCTWFNKSWLDFTGRTMEEEYGNGWVERVHPDDVDRCMKTYVESFDRGIPFNMDYRLLRHDGAYRWMADHGVPIRGPDGSFNGYIGSCIDVTDRKAAEDSMRASEERYRTLFNSIDQGFCVLDVLFDAAGTPVDYLFVETNPAFESQTGLVDTVGKTVRTLVPTIENRWPELYGRVATTGDPLRIEEYSEPLGRWFDVFAFRVAGGEGRRVAVLFRDITQAKRAEQSLRESEARFRTMSDNAPVMIWVTRPDGYCEYLNQKWYDFTGQSEEEARGMGWLKMVHPDDAQRSGEIFVASNARREAFNVEYRLRRRDGVYRWCVDNAAPRFGAGGEYLGYIGSVVDITERAVAEQERAALLEAEKVAREQMAMVVEGANVGVWYCPLPFDKLIWDATTKSHFHVPPDADVSIETFYERIHPDDRDRTRAAIAQSIADRTPYEIDYRTVSPDGRETKWVRATGRAVYGPDNTPTRFDGITIDVTERRRAGERARTILESITDSFFSLDRQWRFVYVNAQAYQLLDTTPARLAGATLWDAYPGLIGTEFEPMYRRAESEGVPGSLVAFYPDHNRWYEVRVYPSSEGYAVYFRDVSEQKRAEVALEQIAVERETLLQAERAARAEAERLSRMKDEFLATLSHELRTPLNAILGWSQIIKSSPGDPKDLTEGLEVIERNARAQAQIIEDLLDMSRIISGKVRLDVQRLDLKAVVEAALATARPAADAKGLRLQAVLDPLPGVAVAGDPGRLQQVMWNLLTNAIKFTPRGGRVQVVLERVDSHIEISVIDTGSGIKAAFLPFVFDRFRQADASTTRRHGGLGLGLSIVKQLVELHGGTVRVKSDGDDSGSTFTLALPVTVLRSETDPDSGREPTVRSKPIGMEDWCADIAGIRVLVVDDEPDAREMVKRLLGDCHAVAVTAGTAGEALQLLAEGTFDVLVSDIGMPGEDGYSLIRRVRALPGPVSAIPAIALTAYARAEDRVKAVTSGFQMHVAKPVEPVELLTMVASLTGRTK
ncbi:MAG TPA: PAS domain S-box protein [Tepidisphaeraceae bacterium]|jgi:PAS domain S-box-containing protein